MDRSRIKDFLEERRIPYQSIAHPLTFTAQGTAAATHISGKAIAKSVILKIDGDLCMAVLPAHMKVDFELLREALEAGRVKLASEAEFQGLFPDCDVGAMPPFGTLYGLKVFVEQSLTEDEYIAFNAGTHRDLIRMAYRDFARIVQPKVIHLSVPAAC